MFKTKPQKYKDLKLSVYFFIKLAFQLYVTQPDNREV